MNKTEVYEVMKSLRVMFPEWNAWVNGLETKQRTLGVYADALESQDKHHVESIIQDWQSGKRKCPEAYERERLIYILVAAARDLRNSEYAKDEARSAVRSYHQEAAEAAKRRSEYNPIRVRGLGWASAAFASAVDAIVKLTGRPKSQWTDEDRAEYDRRADAILKEYQANN